MAAGVTGCGAVVRPIAKLEEQGEERKGITYYIGGAGPIGNVGSWDVPRGLAEGGYQGFVEVFTWQGMTHAGDQINLSRNRAKAAELAAEIKRYRRRYPAQSVHIIALSAGTGIATFALEYLPEDVGVDRVIFLGCSLSSTYDLTRALRRVRGGLYCIHSQGDAILRNVVWYTGTVDRSAGDEGIAGLDGFQMPASKGPDTERQYQKVHNVPYRTDFAYSGYEGEHTDATQKEFVRDFLAPVVLGKDNVLLGRKAEAKSSAGRSATSRPTSRPASRIKKDARERART